ncbi:hypothetical protein [Phyllobacterium ifriqiyense]|uniref:hypothetical protein n=1 Tax=Phyllobacterium ifriqiyense TaxID=314238 RepID=UPI00339969CC
MKIKITKGGIFGADGEIAIGTTLTVKEEPTGWAGRYEVISGDTKDKEPVLNPKVGDVTAKTAQEVLELQTGNFMTFKAEAKKLLGDQTPSNKEEIIAALEELATQP